MKRDIFKIVAVAALVFLTLAVSIGLASFVKFSFSSFPQHSEQPIFSDCFENGLSSYAVLGSVSISNSTAYYGNQSAEMKGNSVGQKNFVQITVDNQTLDTPYNPIRVIFTLKLQNNLTNGQALSFFVGQNSSFLNSLSLDYSMSTVGGTLNVLNPTNDVVYSNSTTFTAGNWYLVELYWSMAPKGGCLCVSVNNTVIINENDVDTQTPFGGGFHVIECGCQANYYPATLWIGSLTVRGQPLVDLPIFQNSAHTPSGRAKTVFSINAYSDTGTKTLTLEQNSTGTFTNTTVSADAQSIWTSGAVAVSLSISGTLAYQWFAQNQAGEYSATDWSYLQVTSDAATFQDACYNSTRAGEQTAFSIQASTQSGSYLEAAKFACNASGTMETVDLPPFADHTAKASLSYVVTLPSEPGVTVQFSWSAQDTLDSQWTTTQDEITTLSVPYPSSLHTSGKQILDENNNPVILKGLNTDSYYNTYYAGQWSTLGNTWLEGLLPAGVWNATVVYQNVDALNSWGINVTRSQIDPLVYINHRAQLISEMQSYANICGNLSMYVVINVYSNLPYPPFTSNAFPNSTAFVNMWADVARNLAPYPNVIYDLLNEPDTSNSAVFNSWLGNATYAGVAQQCIAAIRQYSDQLILVEGNGGDFPTTTVNLKTFAPLVETANDSMNVCLSTHIYDSMAPTYSGLWWWTPSGYTWQGLEQQYGSLGMWNQAIPVVVGEIGCDLNYGTYQGIYAKGGTSLQDELNWFSASLTLFNKHQISYIEYGYNQYGYTSLSGNFAAIQDDAYVPAPSAAGAILVDSINTHPFVLAVGDQAINNQPYIYSNDTAWNSSWNGNYLQVTYSSRDVTYANVWWDTSASFPINASLGFVSTGKTLTMGYNIAGATPVSPYYNDETNIITIPLASTIIPTPTPTPQPVSQPTSTPAPTPATSGQSGELKATPAPAPHTNAPATPTFLATITLITIAIIVAMEYLSIIIMKRKPKS